MAGESEQTKRQRHYDLSMSRRTRKASTPENSQHEDDELRKNSNGVLRTSLRELMNDWNGEEKTNTVDGKTMTETTVGKNLHLSKKQDDGMMAGMVSRYSKVLKHLIKAKGYPRRRGTGCGW